MSDNAEIGIAKTQAKAAQDGLQNHHKSTVSYLNERILTFVCLISFVGLAVIWMTSSSPYLTYGSVAVVIIFSILWGVIRIKRIHKTREQQQRLAKEWKSRTMD